MKHGKGREREMISRLAMHLNVLPNVTKSTNGAVQGMDAGARTS